MAAKKKAAQKKAAKKIAAKYRVRGGAAKKKSAKTGGTGPRLKD